MSKELGAGELQRLALPLGVPNATLRSWVRSEAMIYQDSMSYWIASYTILKSYY